MPPRSANINSIVTNPTTPRIVAIDVAARRILASRSSARSASSTGSGATTILGSWNAKMVATTNPIMASAAANAGPPRMLKPPAIAAPVGPAMELSSASRLLAPTKSCSLLTNCGTTALFETAYPFWSTRTPNASGKSSNVSKCRIMKNASTTRPTSVRMIIIRRPPATLSITGPMSGVTTAKGAIVRISASATRARDSSGLMEKKIDPASAAVIAPSDAAPSACTRASRTNGVTTKPSAPSVLGCGRRSGRQPDSVTPTV